MHTAWSTHDLRPRLNLRGGVPAMPPAAAGPARPSLARDTDTALVPALHTFKIQNNFRRSRGGNFQRTRRSISQSDTGGGR